MKLLTIPVSRFSKRILTSEYGPDPVEIPQADIFFEQLNYQHINRFSRLIKLAFTLNDKYMVRVGDKVADRANKQVFQIGYHLYVYHRRMMVEYASGQVDAGIPIKHALINFYKKYDIGEDDLMLETSVKYWQRFFWKKDDKKFVKNGVNLSTDNLNNTGKNKTYFEFNIPRVDNKIKSIIDRFDLKHTLLYKYPKVMEKKKIETWVWVTVGQRHRSEVMKKLDISEPTYYARLNGARKLLAKNSVIKKILAEAIEEEVEESSVLS
jgi:hypothetical protein